jgi:LPXTG-site transpeptidase (sortase) family protein
VNTVSTRPDEQAEHGDHRTRWLAVLGVVLALVTVTLPWSAPALVDTSDEGAAPVVDTGPEVAPYVVEPEVVFTAADPEPDPAAAAPTRLLVPQLQVDAPVVPIGVSDGVLLPPDDPQTLGWWDQGAVPGAVQGGALITGHTVHTGGGAFDDLETLDKGDAVRVRTLQGTIEYAVTGVTIYRKGRLARDAERVFSQTGPGRLVLITCEDWNGSGYDSNAIVFAERTP